MPNNNEKLNSSVGEKLEISADQSRELNEALADKLEREQRPDDRAERMVGANAELEQIFKHEKQGNTSRQPKQALPAAQMPIKKATKKAKDLAFKKTMQTIQKDMNPAERTFSKVIHNPVVEKTSEVAGKTVARPAALLVGSLTALILVSIVYAVARWYGYALSGFEWIATFIGGWALGLIIDWVRVAILGRHAGPA